MQTKKLSLANMQGKLSRTEMKNIMAGSGDTCKPGTTCATNSDCGYWQCICFKSVCGK